MLKKTVALLSALLMLLGLAACGGNKPFGAADLLQTNLDIIYRGSYTAEALAQCGITAEEADEMYQNSIKTEVSYFCKYFDINEELISEETKSRMYDMYTKIYGKVQYTVGQATETADGYTVELTTSSLLIMQEFLDEDADAIMSDWQQRMDAGEFDLMTDAEREEAWADGIVSAVAARAESSSTDYTGEQTRTTVHITQDADGYFAISDEDMTTIDRLLIAY